jgi:hypothetical protein
MESSRKHTTTNVGKDVEEMNPYPLLWKSVCRFLKILKIELLYDLAITLLDMYLKELK